MTPIIKVEGFISKDLLINHIESEKRKWGEEYDVEQILGDIEDFRPSGITVILPQEDGRNVAKFIPSMVKENEISTDAIPISWIEIYLHKFQSDRIRQRTLRWLVEDWRSANGEERK